MNMEKISEEIKGGEICKGGVFGAMVYDFLKEGERYAKTKHTTYEAEFSVPYKVTIEEEIEPALDENGKPKEFRSEEQKYHLDVTFPFDINGMKGTVDLFVYAKSLEEISQKILEAIGRSLAELKIRPPMKD